MVESGSSRGMIVAGLYLVFLINLSRSEHIEESTVEQISDKPHETLDTAPSDVASVSQFIKQFHRQIDDEAYWNSDRAEKVQVQEWPQVENRSELSAVDASAPESADDVNSTTLVACSTERQAGALTVELVNSTRLVKVLSSNPNITSRSQKADCLVLLFYARTCPFSCMAAPHFNALPRAFPAIKMAAVNALQYQSFNTQYGIVGVPTVMLFHNGRPAAKFNDSEYTLEMFSRFITRHTGVQPEEKMFVTSADFGGPVPSVMARETDYWLALAWLVIGVVGGMGVAKSRMWRSLVEAVQNCWREAEAQHIHAE